jgi:hypothetical protein
MVVRLMAEVERLALKIGDPYLRGVMYMTRGARGLFRADWRVAVEEFSRAEACFGESIGARWERVTCQHQIMTAHVTAGRFGDARENVRFVDEALQFRDRYALNLFQTLPGAWLQLADDQPEQADLAIDDALNGWPRDAFYLPHYQATTARALIWIYMGRSREALDLMLASRKAARQSMILRVPILRAAFTVYAGLAANDVRDRRIQGSLEKLPAYMDRTIYGGVLSIIRGGVAWQAGNRQEAKRHLEIAAGVLEEIDSQVWGWGARHRLGLISGGADGDRMMREAEEAIAKLGVKNPQRMLRLVAPGFDDR